MYIISRILNNFKNTQFTHFDCSDDLFANVLLYFSKVAIHGLHLCMYVTVSLLLMVVCHSESVASGCMSQ